MCISHHIQDAITKKRMFYSSLVLNSTDTTVLIFFNCIELSSRTLTKHHVHRVDVNSCVLIFIFLDDICMQYKSILIVVFNALLYVDRFLKSRIGLVTNESATRKTLAKHKKKQIFMQQKKRPALHHIQWVAPQVVQVLCCLLCRINLDM